MLDEGTCKRLDISTLNLNPFPHFLSRHSWPATAGTGNRGPNPGCAPARVLDGAVFADDDGVMVIMLLVLVAMMIMMVIRAMMMVMILKLPVVVVVGMMMILVMPVVLGARAGARAGGTGSMLMLRELDQVLGWRARQCQRCSDVEVPLRQVVNCPFLHIANPASRLVLISSTTACLRWFQASRRQRHQYPLARRAQALPSYWALGGE